MTLLVTVATDSKVVQASDRLVTLPDGTVHNDKANKVVAVICQGSQFSISFTGAAYVAGKSTDEWIGDYLTDIHAGALDAKAICVSLVKSLTNASPLFSVPYLSLVLCGYLGERPFIALISNFERWRPNKSVLQYPLGVYVLAKGRKFLEIGPPDFHFETFILRKGSNPKKALGLCIHGREKAITERIELKLKRLRKKHFFQNNNSNAVALRLVEIIREASRTPVHGKYIGRDCLTMAISHNPSEDVEVLYHSEKESPKSYGPYIVHPIGSMKGMVSEGATAVKLLFQPSRSLN